MKSSFTIGFTLSVLAAAAAQQARADLFIADGDRIGKYTDGGTLINANFISLTGVTGLTFGPDGLLYAGTGTGGQFGASSIFRYDPNTGAQADAGAFIPYSGIATSPSAPEGMHFGPGGNLYVADVTLSDVYVFSPAGAFITTLSSPTAANPGGPIIAQPTGLTADASHVYVTSGQGVARYNPGPDNFSTFVATGTEAIPQDAAFGPDGDLYVLDASGASPQVLRFDSTGTPDPSFAVHLDDLFLADGIVFQPASINFGPDGLISISGADLFGPGTGSVIQYDLSGNFHGFLIPSAPQGSDALTEFDTFFTFSPAPEPATLGLVAPCVMGLLRRKRAVR